MMFSVVSGMTSGQKAGTAIGVLIAIGAIVAVTLLIIKYRKHDDFRQRLHNFGFNNPTYGNTGESVIKNEVTSEDNDDGTDA